MCERFRGTLGVGIFGHIYPQVHLPLIKSNLLPRMNTPTCKRNDIFALGKKIRNEEASPFDFFLSRSHDPPGIRDQRPVRRTWPATGTEGLAAGSRFVRNSLN